MMIRGGGVVWQARYMADCSGVGTVVCTTVPVGPSRVTWA